MPSLLCYSEKLSNAKVWKEPKTTKYFRKGWFAIGPYLLF
jgi:hypothetical protein